ncbi:MAG: hypothetical protein HY982_00815 [Candidatus Magasanikbacteria bacterium]|nr:hypothetical protein [Candidatus Magasanikbacteria bacterium]
MARLIREDHLDFRVAMRQVLEAQGIEGADWHEHYRNVGHLLGQRQKPRLSKVTDEVSLLIHKSWNFESALRQVLAEYGFWRRYSWYARRVGKELAERKRKQRAREARKIQKEAKAATAAAKKAVKASRSAGGRKKPVAATAPVKPLPPPLEMVSLSEAEVAASDRERRAERQRYERQRQQRPARHQRRYRDSAVQGKLFA